MDRPRVTGEEGARLRRAAATASLSVAIFLAVLKLGAALASGSLAVLASLIDSLADVVASGITYLSVKISRQPPDRRHRFGHGKAESLSALAQSTLVAGSAVFVCVDAVRRLNEPDPIVASGVAIAVMLVAAVTTVALVQFQRSVVARTGSPAIAADSLHYRADLATNLLVVGSVLAVDRLGWLWLDPLVASAIAFYLALQAARIGRDAINTLMDHELPTRQRALIERIVASHTEVHGLHDLRTREAGGTVFIELHVELDPQMTVAAAHLVTDALERELLAAFASCATIIHQEPAGLDDERLDAKIASASRWR